MARRRRLRVEGTVQGVGFRPFVFTLARDLGLTGWVSNTSAGVIIEAEGTAAALDELQRRLRDDAPPLAEVAAVTAAEQEPAGDAAFVIRFSEDTPGTDTSLPPDVAVCADCRREIRDPADRRHGYPFTNCTNCGPRWTIIDRIPYDRPFTSMAGFPMCPACRAEYDDPADRRFHAQPNACPDCGPRLTLHGEGLDAAADPLAETARLLAAGRIAAIKGLGGFHLAVRADDEAAVRR
ncbi:carbamoyltransferase HypF, partial [bacterium]|nr:carbamoyltransferase HypF [bacterium]